MWIAHCAFADENQFSVGKHFLLLSLSNSHHHCRLRALWRCRLCRRRSVLIVDNKATAHNEQHIKARWTKRIVKWKTFWVDWMPFIHLLRLQFQTKRKLRRAERKESERRERQWHKTDKIYSDSKANSICSENYFAVFCHWRRSIFFTDNSSVRFHSSLRSIFLSFFLLSMNSFCLFCWWFSFVSFFFFRSVRCACLLTTNVLKLDHRSMQNVFFFHLNFPLIWLSPFRLFFMLICVALATDRNLISSNGSSNGTRKKWNWKTLPTAVFILNEMKLKMASVEGWANEPQREKWRTTQR